MGVAVTAECANLWVWLLEWDVGDMESGWQGSTVSLASS